MRPSAFQSDGPYFQLIAGRNLAAWFSNLDVETAPMAMVALDRAPTISPSVHCEASELRLITRILTRPDELL